MDETINSFSSVSDKDPLGFWRGNIKKVDRNSLESIN